MLDLKLFEKYFNSYSALSDNREESYHLLPYLKLYGDCHRQLSHTVTLESDTKDLLCGYFGIEHFSGDYDIKLAVENFFTSIYRTVIEFFKNLIRKVTDYVKDLFNWHHHLSARNKKILSDIKPYFIKYQKHLDKVKVPSSVPNCTKLEDVTRTILDFTTKLLKVDIKKLERDVNDVLSDKTNYVNYSFDYSAIFGTNYLESFTKIGLEPTDTDVRFVSVFIGEQSQEGDLHSLNYTYEKLEHVNNVYDKQLDSQLHQMREAIISLEKIKTDIERLGHARELDSEKEERNKRLVLELPPQILKTIGIMQKCSTASMTYQTKLNEILSSIYSSFKTFISLPTN